MMKDLNKSEFLTKLTEINGATYEIDHCISNLDKWAKDEIVDTSGHLAPARSKLVYEPLGVALILGAWNFPLIISLKSCISAICAGNCVILKPSENSPNSMAAM